MKPSETPEQQWIFSQAMEFPPEMLWQEPLNSLALSRVELER